MLAHFRKTQPFRKRLDQKNNLLEKGWTQKTTF